MPQITVVKKPPKWFYTILIVSLAVSVTMFFTLNVSQHSKISEEMVEQAPQHEPREKGAERPLELEPPPVTGHQPSETYMGWQVFILQLLELSAPWAPVLVPIIYFLFGKPAETVKK